MGDSLSCLDNLLELINKQRSTKCALSGPVFLFSLTGKSQTLESRWNSFLVTAFSSCCCLCWSLRRQRPSDSLHFSGCVSWLLGKVWNCGKCAFTPSAPQWAYPVRWNVQKMSLELVRKRAKQGLRRKFTQKCSGTKNVTNTLGSVKSLNLGKDLNVLKKYRSNLKVLRQ